MQDNDDKKGLTLLPTLNQSDEDNSDAIEVASKSDESRKQTDESPKQTDESPEQTDEPPKQTPLLFMSSLTVMTPTPSLDEHQSEAVPEGKMKNVLFPPHMKDRYPSLSQTDSSPSEVKLKTSYIYPSKIKKRNLDSSPAEIRSQSNTLSLGRRKNRRLVSPDSKSKSRFQSQDPEEDLELKVSALVLEL